DYTIIWHKNKMIFKIDDKEYGRITDKQIMDKINKNEHFLVLALTVGGDLNFNDGEILRAHKEAIFSNSEPNHHIKFFEAIHLWKDWKDPSLVIDYIRIFTTNESEE
ncbi:CG34254, partial [Drosophila busckii]